MTMRLPVNSERTDWVSTGGAYKWGQEAYVDHDRQGSCVRNSAR